MKLTIPITFIFLCSLLQHCQGQSAGIKQTEEVGLPHGHYDPACVYDTILEHLVTPGIQNELLGATQSVVLQMYKRLFAASGLISEAVELYLKHADPRKDVAKFKADVMSRCGISASLKTVMSDPLTGGTRPIADPEIERISEILSDLFDLNRFSAQ